MKKKYSNIEMKDRFCTTYNLFKGSKQVFVLFSDEGINYQRKKGI